VTVEWALRFAGAGALLTVHFPAAASSISMSALLFRRVLVATESAPPTEADVLVEGGVIRGVEARGFGAGDVPPGTRTIEGAGRKILAPAFFDPHVHLREPGKIAAETIQSGTEAAINGGITGVVAMPNTTPATDSGPMVKNVRDIAARTARIPVYVCGAITKGRQGEELAAIAAMKSAGAVMISDDGDPVENPQVLRRAMEYARDFDVMLASHCETKALSGPGAINEGRHAYKLGLFGTPALSEELCLARDCRLAQFTGARLHIQHVTTVRGMRTIDRYKNEGVRVTGEVAPHHLLFIDEDIGDYDTHYKMNPPLRTPEDRAGLIEGLKNGLFDCIATDHAPHTDFEKKREFVAAPNGITGLETAVVSLFHYFIREDEFGWDVLVKRYSAEPRRLVGVPVVSVAAGQTAELALFDPDATTTFSRAFMKSKSQNTPFLNKTLQGAVEMVVLGEAILKDAAAPAA
jgi:dihydroorotase